MPKQIPTARLLTVPPVMQGFLALPALFKMDRLEPYRHHYPVPMEGHFREYHNLRRRTARRN